MTRPRRPVLALAAVIALARSFATVLILLRGWWRIQTEWPPERPERVRRLRIRIGESNRTLLIRDNQSDLICLLEILVEQSYGPAVAADRAQPQVIYDIGANIGIASAYFRACFPSAWIVAFEPGLPELALLRENTDSRTLILPVALTHGRLRIAQFRVSDRASGGQHLADHWAESEDRFPFESTSVVAGSLHYVACSLGLPAADIVKIDIEGGELPVLRDLIALPTPPKVIVAELHNARIEAEAIGILTGFGYRSTHRDDGRQGTSVMTFIRLERTN